eukprot:COSAG03_NODE_3396_length_2040_cov_5.294178_3_plen_79_part_00
MPPSLGTAWRPMVRLRLEPSESFKQPAEIEVSLDGIQTVEALLGVVGEKLSAEVTELFAWDDVRHTLIRFPVGSPHNL